MNSGTPVPFVFRKLRNLKESGVPDKKDKPREYNFPNIDHVDIEGFNDLFKHIRIIDLTIKENRKIIGLE